MRKPTRTKPATDAAVGESVLLGLYAVTRGRTGGDDRDKEARHTEEGRAKRSKLPGEGSDRLAGLPGREGSWAGRMAFPLSTSEFSRERELLHGFLKMDRVYSGYRNAQGRDKVRNKHMVARREKGTAGARSEMLVAEEAREQEEGKRTAYRRTERRRSQKRGRGELPEEEKAKRR